MFSNKTCWIILVFAVIADMIETRTIQEQEKCKNNEHRPKFTSSYKEKRVLCISKEIKSLLHITPIHGKFDIYYFINPLHNFLSCYCNINKN